MPVMAACCLETLRIGDRQQFGVVAENLRERGVSVKDCWLTEQKAQHNRDKRFVAASLAMEELLSAITQRDERAVKVACHQLKHKAGLSVTVNESLTAKA
jgi:hypothetical protein